MQFETKAIQSTQLKDNTAGSVASPLYLSTTFERAADGSHPHGYVYSRAENPNRELLESAMAVLENGEKALAFSSGMAAVNALFQTFTLEFQWPPRQVMGKKPLRCSMK